MRRTIASSLQRLCDPAVFYELYASALYKRISLTKGSALI
jgi:hypothetical protein